jgi:myxalamid-type polyketide synthase MxaB
LALVEELHQLGATVSVLQADVSNAEELRPRLTVILRSLPPLRGVFHAAGVFADRVLADHRWALFERVFAAKVLGSWNLHLLTRDTPLDMFVLFSSVASLLGGSGVANYIAANSFVDSLSHYRRSLGLPSLSVNWGLWQDTGMAEAVRAKSESLWSSSGIECMLPAEALDALELAASHDVPQAGILRMNWNQYFAQFAGGEIPPFVNAFATGRCEPAPSNGILRRLSAATPARRTELLSDHVRSLLCEVLAFPQTTPIDPRRGLFDLGMDSLTAITLRNRLQASLNCTLSNTVAFQHASIQSLTDHLLCDVLSADAAGRSGFFVHDDGDDDADPESRYGRLTEDEAVELLEAKLAKIEKDICI